MDIKAAPFIFNWNLVHGVYYHVDKKLSLQKSAASSIREIKADNITKSFEPPSKKRLYEPKKFSVLVHHLALEDTRYGRETICVNSFRSRPENFTRKFYLRN